MGFAGHSNNPYDLAAARTFESWLFCLLREPQGAEVAAMQALAVIEEHGFPFIRNLTHTMLGSKQRRPGSSRPATRSSTIRGA
jgi:hypothetical protein